MADLGGTRRRRAAALLAGVAVLLGAAVVGCSGDDDAGKDTGTTAPSRATEAEPGAEAAPSTTASTTTAPAPPLPAATVAARRAFFGEGNVDAGGHLPHDEVIASWFGVASLAVSFGDRVVLLDTAINNPGDCVGGEAPGGGPYVPATGDQLVALAPVAIFVGHGHSDHACHVGRIAVDSGATVVGLPQHCAQARDEVGDGGTDGAQVACVEALAADSPFGTTADVAVPPLGEDVHVTAVRNLHSGRDGEAPCNSGGCEAVLYRFEMGDLSLVWNDTNGPLSTAAPEVLTALRRLRPSDVQFGAILGLGIGTQGMRDPVDYAEALRVGELYPLHHDTTRGGGSAGFRGGLEAEMDGRPDLATTLHWLQDPGDYLKPLVLPTTAGGADD
jgi:hypothetical protein